MKYAIILAIILWSCNQQDQNKKPTDNIANAAKSHNLHSSRQLNLTILLDLSDRIDPRKYSEKPEHYQRDSALISYLTDHFIDQMDNKGAYLAKSKMRVVFHPTPPDQGINEAASRMNVNLAPMATKAKKEIYDSLKQTVANSIHQIYSSTLQHGSWPGSDIWRFFKNDVIDVAIDKDSNYRNLLVIFTDGYLLHKDSKDRKANRYAYISSELFDSYRLRNNNQWRDILDKNDLGLITTRSDLKDLEILVLEISPLPNHRNDEDIIHTILDKWFGEMKVKKWKLLNSDLPDLTKQKIESFLNN